MRRKVLSLFTVFTILMSYTGIMTATANAENVPIELGECVQMGTYNGRPILWRCVAFEKVIGTDGNGNPIIDSTQTVTEYRDGYLPLMFADTSICEKPFDTKGNNTNGSHGRADNRVSHGSNYWADSNIRDWLNSSAPAGGVSWTCGNEPPYSEEAGFLSCFSEKEKAAMNTVSQKSILMEYDKDVPGAVGSEKHAYNESISEVVQNYKQAYSEQVTDTMFLLDVQQMKNVYDIFGDYYQPYYYPLYSWLRTPVSFQEYLVRVAFTSGGIGEYLTGSMKVGVRPAFYLNPSTLFLYGSGSRNNPHTLVPTHIHDMSAECSSESTVIFNKELTCADGRVYIDGVCLEPVTNSDGTYFELPAGNYCLMEDAWIDACVEIKGKVNLCLNSNTLNMGESGITVRGETGIFNLYDCGEGGAITSAFHNGASDSALITACEHGVFSLYGGKVMNTSDKKYSYKQAVSVLSGTVRLYGGEVVALDDNAVYFGGNAEKIVLSGAPQIKGSDSKADIYLRNNGDKRQLTLDGSLTNTEPYKIGAIRAEVFTAGWNKYMTGRNFSDYFVSATKGRMIGQNKDGELEIYDCAVLEQPSESNGYTIATSGVPASYVWYPATVTTEEVTGQNASAYERNGQASTYDSTDGWTGVYDKDMNKSYFKIRLSKGEVLKAKLSAPLEEFSMVSLTDTMSGDFQDVCNANSEGEYVFTAQTDAEYVLSVAGLESMKFPTVTATAIETVLGSAVEGQTANKFTGGAGAYLCEVTYADGTVLRSNVVETAAAEYSLKYENGQAVVSVSRDGTYAVIFASYDVKGRLLSVSVEHIPLVKGEQKTVSPTNFNANGTVKVMLWDSLDGAKPLCAAAGR